MGDDNKQPPRRPQRGRREQAADKQYRQGATGFASAPTPCRRDRGEREWRTYRDEYEASGEVRSVAKRGYPTPRSSRRRVPKSRRGTARESMRILRTCK